MQALLILRRLVRWSHPCRCDHFWNASYTLYLADVSNFIQSNASWQIPLVLQCAACLVVLSLVAFVPESPRFLLAVGKGEQAHAMLTRFHGGGDPDNALVQLELHEMKTAIALDNQTVEAWWDYRSLFATRGNRWRMLQASMMAVFGQFSGNGLACGLTVYLKLTDRLCYRHLPADRYHLCHRAVGLQPDVLWTGRYRCSHWRYVLHISHC